MKIKIMRENGQEILIDTTRDAVAILLSPAERQNLSDIAKVKDTMMLVPYRRMQPTISGGHDLTWWQQWGVSGWGDHLDGGKNNDVVPFLDRIRAAEG